MLIVIQDIFQTVLEVSSSVAYLQKPLLSPSPPRRLQHLHLQKHKQNITASRTNNNSLTQKRNIKRDERFQ
jgi:hypothetical protein